MAPDFVSELIDSVEPRTDKFFSWVVSIDKFFFSRKTYPPLQSHLAFLLCQGSISQNLHASFSTSTIVKTLLVRLYAQHGKLDAYRRPVSIKEGRQAKLGKKNLLIRTGFQIHPEWKTNTEGIRTFGLSLTACLSQPSHVGRFCLTCLSFFNTVQSLWLYWSW